MNLKRRKLLHGIQFSVRTLLILTAIVGFEVAFISKARSSSEAMAHLVLVQLGLLVICWLYYQHVQHGGWGYRCPRHERLYLGIGIASIVYGGTVYTVFATATQQLQDSVTHPGTVTVNIVTVSQAPIICMMIALVSVACAFTTTAMIHFMHSLFWKLFSKTPQEINPLILGGIVGGITPLGLLFFMGGTREWNAVFVLLTILLPAAIGAVSCHLFSREQATSSHPSSTDSLCANGRRR